MTSREIDEEASVAIQVGLRDGCGGRGKEMDRELGRGALGRKPGQARGRDGSRVPGRDLQESQP